MLDRRNVAEHDGGEQLTTCAVGRDGLGCASTAFQLKSTQHSLGRARGTRRTGTTVGAAVATRLTLGDE